MLFMIFSGYFRPLIGEFANNMELINETLTLVCSYSLFIFSAFVPDAGTRYLMGWQLIVLVLMTLGFNLAVIFYGAIKLAIQKCKHKIKRRNWEKKVKEHKEHL